MPNSSQLLRKVTVSGYASLDSCASKTAVNHVPVSLAKPSLPNPFGCRSRIPSAATRMPHAPVTTDAILACCGPTAQAAQTGPMQLRMCCLRWPSGQVQHWEASMQMAAHRNAFTMPRSSMSVGQSNAASSLMLRPSLPTLHGTPLHHSRANVCGTVRPCMWAHPALPARRTFL